MTRWPAALILLCCAHVTFGADTSAGRQKVEGFLQGLQSLQANFKQLLIDRSGQIVEEASGELAIRSPRSRHSSTVNDGNRGNLPVFDLCVGGDPAEARVTPGGAVVGLLRGCALGPPGSELAAAVPQDGLHRPGPVHV